MQRANFPLLRMPMLRRTRTFLAGMAGLLLMAALSLPAAAQLNGTYTIGGSAPNYATIDAAVAALSAGVSGPVSFRIRTGTYVPPTGGWVLNNFTGMSVANTVTFKPDAGATVTITGNTGVTNGGGVFVIDRGKYFVIDGSNSTNGTSRDMTVIQTEINYAPAIFLKNDADNNVIKNCRLQAASSSGNTTYGLGVVTIGMSNQASGNDNNLIQNCQIGDPTGLNRAWAGVGMYGQSSTILNSGNRIANCDIINQRFYGVYIDLYNSAPKIQKNDIHMTLPSPTTSIYGIYTNESSSSVALNGSIDSNRIYRLQGISTAGAASSMSIYGIYSNMSDLATGTMQISNNMISMAENGYIYYYGIYLNHTFSAVSSSAYTVNIYHNSIYASGTATSFAQTQMLYRYSYASNGLAFSTINHRNNAYYSTRAGGSSSSYGLYVYSSPSGGWNSNYNLIDINSDVNYYTAYYNFSLYTTLASYQTSGQDANSVGTSPKFIDPNNGDLHISTTSRTAVESRGTPIAGFTTDYDGQNRSGTTPDIGADEGTFLPTLGTDAAADRFALPLAGGTVKSNTLFSPVGYIDNNGATAGTIQARYRILNSAGGVVYNDLQTYSVGAFMPMRIPFNSTGNTAGSTSLAAGIYTIELSTTLAGDGDATNNTITGTLYIRDGFSGVYTINKAGGGIRNYTSFTAAINDLNTLGVVGATTFNVAAGSYDSTTEAFPLRFSLVTGMSAANTVTFKPDVNAQVTMNSFSPTGLIELDRGTFYTFDGSNSVGGTSRDWKIVNSGVGPTIRLANGAQNNAVKNLYIIGSSLATQGIVKIDNTSAGLGNSFNTISNNLIGDTSGVFRSFADIYLTGDATYRNVANVIDNNDIVNWGSNTNGGGYGIYWNTYNDQMKVFRNRLRQMNTSALTSFGACYGIFITNTLSTNDTIAYNKIWNLATPTATTTQIGVYVSTYGTTTPLTIHNNMISLAADGGGIYGIYVAPASPVTVISDHNSIAIRGTGNTTLGAYLGTNIRIASSANMTIRNNVLANERTYPSTTASYLIYRSSSAGTVTSNYNDLYFNGLGTALGYNFGTNYTTLASWQGAGYGYDANSIVTRPTFISPTTGDLHIDPVAIFGGEGVGQALGYTKDIDQQNRDLVTPDLGADDGDFNGGGIKLTSPNGNETFLPADVIPVQYTTNRIMAVRIDFSSDGGATWTPLTTVNPTVKGTNTSNVTLPNIAVNAALLRVMSTKNIYEGDTTDAPFKLIRKLKILMPNGGEKLLVGDQVMLKWDRKPGEQLAEYINLDYSTNSGSTWQVIASQIPAYLDSLPWMVPNTPTTTALVRLSNTQAPRFWDSSDAVFSIGLSTIHITAPNGGEKYELAQPINVTWTSQNATTLRLEYSPDNGATWQKVATGIPAAAGTYSFTPTATPTKLALVRLLNADRERIFDQSDATFELMQEKSISVLTPAASDKLVRNSTTAITWDAPRVSRVNIQYSSNAGAAWQTIASNILASEGAFIWTVPNQTVQQAKIRIVDAADLTLFGESGLFSIVDPISVNPTLHVSSPNGGEIFTEGDPINLRWTSSGINAVTVSFSNDSGASWTTIAPAVPASLGLFKWTAPANPATTYLLRVTSGNPAVSDQSDNVFTVTRALHPALTVIRPNGGEILSIDSTEQIRWSATDLTGNVSIDYSIDGTTWKHIASAAASAGSYNWTVPNDTSSHAMLRITSADGKTVDSSNAVFSISRMILPQIVVLSPNGGEVWATGQTRQITWSAPAAVTSVDIAYSFDGGASWKTAATAVASAPGSMSYAWSIPGIGATTSAALVRVSNAAIAGNSDISDQPFTVKVVSGGVEEAQTGASGLRLVGCYPNPLSQTTQIRWQQRHGGVVELRVYRQSGMQVGSYGLGMREQGEQTYLFDGGVLSSGTYVYELREGGSVVHGMMIVLH